MLSRLATCVAPRAWRGATSTMVRGSTAPASWMNSSTPILSQQATSLATRASSVLAGRSPYDTMMTMKSTTSTTMMSGGAVTAATLGPTLGPSLASPSSATSMRGMVGWSSTSGTSGGARRSVWSAGQDPVAHSHSSSSLTPGEIEKAARVVREALGPDRPVRFVAIALAEGSKDAVDHAPRTADVIVLQTASGLGMELSVDLDAGTILSQHELAPGVQPLLTPEDCDLAEAICHESPQMQQIFSDRYGITNPTAQVGCDPWSFHLASDTEVQLTRHPETNAPRRLVQLFLYRRGPGDGDMRENAYAYPLDITAVVDLNAQEVVQIDNLDRDPVPTIPSQSVNYHRDLVETNSYLQTAWREDTLKALNITQPDGPSFTVSDHNLVEWQGWSFRVGFHYREGLVLHDVEYQGRPVLKRGSLVEMSVPYADPYPPHVRKCALDVGDYGLGYSANSLELGCDCLGHIHYFDAYLNNVAGEPVYKPKVVCMHEEDAGLLWKHVEYRNGHNEARRARELVISSIATVVNYEYLFYWRLRQDGSIDFEIRLSGELSTNLTSAAEDPDHPTDGVLVAPGGVNAQVHQHMFCARLDMSVDGESNIVSEVDIESVPYDAETNPYGNIFRAKETVLASEREAVRMADATKARTWKISSTEQTNPITQKPTAYKLIPFTRGPAQPTLLTSPECAVSQKSQFAQAHLWVTKYDPQERYPAGDYPTQSTVFGDGLPTWIAERNADLSQGEDVVLWHSFGVTHVPRVEDFPVMPCETTGFTLKPDGFFTGNPAIDLPPDTNEKSELASGCCK